MDTAAKTPIDRKAIGIRSAALRSRLSNLRDVLPDVDGRSSAARRFRDIVASITTDKGGAEQLTEVELQRIRRFAGLCVICEQNEACIARGEPVNIAEHATLANAATRIASQIGVNRVSRDVTPTFGDLWRADQIEQQQRQLQREAQQREALPQGEGEQT
jgi:hypothetical protein